MTKRIFRSIFLVASAVLLASLAIVLGILYNYFSADQLSSLRAKAVLAARGVESEGEGYLRLLTPEGYRLTWIAADGAVLYDSEADVSTMENHGNREEVQEALLTGIGESRRASSTLSANTFYHAVRLSDGTVLRVSETQYTVVTLLMGLMQPLVLLLGGAVALSAILANRVSKRIVEPLNALDLEHPLENDSYEELSPLLTRIEQQHRQIAHQVEELRQHQEEFDAVTESMNEGLILLNGQGEILSINPAAQRLFQTRNGCIGHDFLTVDRSLAMQKLVHQAQAGSHSEAVLPLCGGMYQLDASPVLAKSARGICILAFDVTDKAKSEQLRREFTANVSHELKTPLHAIMGSAELIENGLVKEADLWHFVGNIRSEAARLVTLINDIIQLSQLDEGGEIPRENVELLSLASEAAAALLPQAKAAGISVTVRGDSASIMGVRRLLYEICYNLCDNAIKYNRPGGAVTMTVSVKADGAALTVSDTGIGIAPEHQSRIFERFYRVDKSHSKETGGTGLGLSIVKHAAQYHGAAIRVESEPGKGTSIHILFPAVSAPEK